MLSLLEQEMLSQKNNLNKINVFPVPDGDTGTNLASLMNSIIEKSSLKTLLQRLC